MIPLDKISLNDKKVYQRDNETGLGAAIISGGENDVIFKIKSNDKSYYVFDYSGGLSGAVEMKDSRVLPVADSIDSGNIIASDGTGAVDSGLEVSDVEQAVRNIPDKTRALTSSDYLQTQDIGSIVFMDGNSFDVSAGAVANESIPDGATVHVKGPGTLNFNPATKTLRTGEIVELTVSGTVVVITGSYTGLATKGIAQVLGNMITERTAPLSGSRDVVASDQGKIVMLAGNYYNIDPSNVIYAGMVKGDRFAVEGPGNVSLDSITFRTLAGGELLMFEIIDDSGLKAAITGHYSTLLKSDILQKTGSTAQTVNPVTTFVTGLTSIEPIEIPEAVSDGQGVNKGQLDSGLSGKSSSITERTAPLTGNRDVSPSDIGKIVMMDGHVYSAASIKLDIASIDLGSRFAVQGPGTVNLDQGPTELLANEVIQVEVVLKNGGPSSAITGHYSTLLKGDILQKTGSTAQTVAPPVIFNKPVAVPNAVDVVDAVNLGQLNSGLSGKSGTSHTHAATAISFAPTSGIAATDVQAAIVEAKTDASTYTDGEISDLSGIVLARIPLTQKGAANGVAPLGSDSKIPAFHMPDGWLDIDGGDGAGVSTDRTAFVRARRGTRAVLNGLAGAQRLVNGELFFVTDENKFLLGKGVGNAPIEVGADKLQKTGSTAQTVNPVTTFTNGLTSIEPVNIAGAVTDGQAMTFGQMLPFTDAVNPDIRLPQISTRTHRDLFDNGSGYCGPHKLQLHTSGSGTTNAASSANIGGGGYTRRLNAGTTASSHAYIGEVNTAATGREIYGAVKYELSFPKPGSERDLESGSDIFIGWSSTGNNPDASFVGLRIEGGTGKYIWRSYPSASGTDNEVDLGITRGGGYAFGSRALYVYILGPTYQVNALGGSSIWRLVIDEQTSYSGGSRVLDTEIAKNGSIYNAMSGVYLKGGTATNNPYLDLMAMTITECPFITI